MAFSTAVSLEPPTSLLVNLWCSVIEEARLSPSSCPGWAVFTLESSPWLFLEGRTHGGQRRRGPREVTGHRGQAKGGRRLCVQAWLCVLCPAVAGRCPSAHVAQGPCAGLVSQRMSQETLMVPCDERFCSQRSLRSAGEHGSAGLLAPVITLRALRSPLTERSLYRLSPFFWSLEMEPRAFQTLSCWATFLPLRFA